MPRSLNLCHPLVSHNPEKRKVGSSILSLTTSFGPVSSALTSADSGWALLCLQPPGDRDYPRATVVGRSLSHADRTPCLHALGSRPLRPELAAPLGVWLSSQLAECATGRRCWRLCEDVAVLPCRAVYRISSSGRGGSDRFRLDQRPRSVLPAQRCTLLNCNPNCNPLRVGLGESSWTAPCSHPVIYALRGCSLSSRAGQLRLLTWVCGVPVLVIVGC